MSIRIEGSVIVLEDQVHVEQAEHLLERLNEDPSRSVDLSGCRHLHSAVVQVLLSHGVRVSGAPTDTFLRRFVAPNFKPLENLT